MKEENGSKKYLPDFLTIPCVLIRDKTLQQLDCLVYGVVYWYKRLKLEKCVASNKTIADLLLVDSGSVANSLSRLSKHGYIEIIYAPNMGKNKIRLEIIPLIVFRDPSSTNDTPLHLQMIPPSSTDDTPPSSTDEENNNIIEKEDLGRLPSPLDEKTAKTTLPAKRLLEKPYSQMDWLTKLTQDDIIYFQEKFTNLPESLIKKEADKAYWWLRDKQVVKKDYRGFLRNWLEKTSQNWGNKNEKEQGRVRDI